MYWVTVGERPDVLAGSCELLERLGAGGAAPRTVDEAAERLRERLADRRMLLVVDDVWSDAAARAFRVDRTQGRVLYTTARPAVLDAPSGPDPPRWTCCRRPRARGWPPAGSLGHARASAAGARPTGCSRHVGRVALAVALLAAAVRGGRSWDQVGGRPGARPGRVR